MLERFTRFVALLALLLALTDSGRLLGVGSGGADPFVTFGMTGFVLLVGHTVARLFAAVGMWIQSNWGTALLFLATLSELLLFLLGPFRMDIGFVGFVLRLLTFAGASLILWMLFNRWRRAVHD